MSTTSSAKAAAVGSCVTMTTVWPSSRTEPRRNSSTSALDVLSRLPVSVAYPLQSLGFVLVVIFAHLILNESLSASKLVAIALIVLGVLLLARGRA